MFQPLDLEKLTFSPFRTIGKRWMLVSAGDREHYNTMTASWGGLGVLWNKNVAMIYLRPQRYTKEFIEANERFTLSFFDESERSALQFCGSHSGRDCDKAKETGLVPTTLDGSVTFFQAKMVFVCQKLYKQDFLPDGFLDPSLVEKNYPHRDFHTMYVAEILSAYAQ